MKLPYPLWLRDMPEGEAKDRAKNRFVLRLCCLYAHPGGRIHHFADVLGMNENTLKTQIQSDKLICTDEVRDKIKSILGPEFVPPRPRYIKREA